MKNPFLFFIVFIFIAIAGVLAFLAFNPFCKACAVCSGMDYWNPFCQIQYQMCQMAYMTCAGTAGLLYYGLLAFIVLILMGLLFFTALSRFGNVDIKVILGTGMIIVLFGLFIVLCIVSVFLQLIPGLDQLSTPFIEVAQLMLTGIITVAAGFLGVAVGGKK